MICNPHKYHTFNFPYSIAIIFVLLTLLLNFLEKFINRNVIVNERVYYDSYVDCYADNYVNELRLKPSELYSLPEFDIARIVKRVQEDDDHELPSNFSEYKKLPEKSIGIFEDWQTNIGQHADLCEWLMKCVKNWIVENNDSARSVVKDFIERYMTSPRTNYKIQIYEVNNLCAMYIVGLFANNQIPSDDFKQAEMAILYDDNVYGLNNMQRLFKLFPLLVLLKAKNMLESELSQNSTLNNQVRNLNRSYGFFNYVQGAVGFTSGMYEDNTYVVNDNLATYIYFYKMNIFFKYYENFDLYMPPFERTFSRIRKLLLHPSIGYGGCVNMWHHRSSLDILTESDTKLGLAVLPFNNIVRMFGDNYSFTIRACRNKLSSYISDIRYVNDMYEYAILARESYVSGKTYDKLSLNVRGFIFRDKKPTGIVGLSSSSKLNDYNPLFCTTKASYVISSDKIGYVYQDYILSLPSMLLLIREEIVLDYDAGTVDVIVQPSAAVDYNIYYCLGGDYDPIEVKPGNNVFISYTVNCSSNQHTTGNRTAFRYGNKNIELPQNHTVSFINRNQIVMSIDNKPKFAYDSTSTGSETIYVNGRIYTFSRIWNQYVVDDCTPIDDLPKLITQT